METRTSPETFSEPLGVRRVLEILRRRLWVVIACALVVPFVAGVFSVLQTAEYESSADVVLSQQNLAGTITGTSDGSSNNNPERVAATQAKVARSPEVAEKTVTAVGADMTGNDLLAASSVSANADADLLTFRVKDTDAGQAGRLATEYANQFIAYRLQLDTAAIATARRDLAARIAQVREAGGDPQLLDRLNASAQTLQTLETLQTSNAVLVRPAEAGSKVSPKTTANILLGFGLGLFLGIGLAFLLEAVNSRVRTAEEISQLLGIHLLARLPEPPRRLRAANQLVMVEEPWTAQAEAFRMLRTNLDFVNPDRRARVIAVTSAVSEEGKLTTAANLAVALAMAGSSVILVDLDLRLPTLHRFFGIPTRPGATDVARSDSELSEALSEVPLDVSEPSMPVRNGRRVPRTPGLRVLPSGALPRDAGEFAGSPPLAALLSGLRDQCDVVIVDTPPILKIGDTMAMSVNLDGLLIVARLNVVSRPMLADLRRSLDRTRAVKLGVVVTGASATSAYGGYYGGGRRSTEAPEKKAIASEAVDPVAPE